MKVTAFIALGSNLGDRQGYLDQALQQLRGHGRIEVTKVSQIRETTPVGGPAGQGPYLNAVAEVHTDLDPHELQRALPDIEQNLGRVRKQRFGRRTIDLDLLLYGDLVRSEFDLIIPHPRLAERAFVLEPLAELAPEVVHPVFGRTIGDLWNELRQPAETP